MSYPALHCIKAAPQDPDFITISGSALRIVPTLAKDTQRPNKWRFSPPFKERQGDSIHHLIINPFTHLLPAASEYKYTDAKPYMSIMATYICRIFKQVRNEQKN